MQLVKLTPRLFNDIIKINHQISQFLAAIKYTHLNEISDDVDYTIQYIFENYVLSKRQVSESSRYTRISSSELSTFSYTWTTDLSAFRRSIKAFRNRTIEFRKESEIRQYIRFHNPPFTENISQYSSTNLPSINLSSTSSKDTIKAISIFTISTEETEEARRKISTPVLITTAFLQA